MFGGKTPLKSVKKSQVGNRLRTPKTVKKSKKQHLTKRFFVQNTNPKGVEQMPNRYYIGNPRTILTPDAYESVFAVDSSIWRTNRLRKLTNNHDSRCTLVPKSANENRLLPIPGSNASCVNMIRDSYRTETHLIFVPAMDSITIDDRTAICFEVPDDIFAYVGFSGWNPLTLNFTITLHVSFYGRVFSTPDSSYMKGLNND